MCVTCSGTGEDGGLIKSTVAFAVRLLESRGQTRHRQSAGNSEHRNVCVTRQQKSLGNLNAEHTNRTAISVFEGLICYTHDRLCSLALREEYSAVVGVFKTRLPCRIFRHHTEITGGWKQVYTISILCLIQVRRLMKRVMGWTYSMQRVNAKSNKTVVGKPEQERPHRIN